jgi:hypothetical protein
MSAVQKDHRNKNGDDQAQALAKQILIAFTGAYKKINLYPADHAIYKTALRSLQSLLDNFFAEYGDLEFEIDRNQIRRNGQIVYKGEMTEDNPAFIMFRDGIYRIEFKTTITLWEIHGFLEILQKYQKLTEESENDVVTALWENNLPSLLYKADDVGFDTGEEFEVPDLYDGEAPDDSQASDNTDAVSESTAKTNLSLKDKRLWELTPEDWDHLRKMIAAEEEWESIEYVLYILLYILQHQTQPDNFSDVIDILKQELQSALAACKFKSVYDTIELLKKNLEHPKSKSHWSIAYLENFFAALSSNEFLKILDHVWEKIDDHDTQGTLYLKRSLLLLKPDALHTLGPMLVKRKPPKIQKMLMAIIAAMAEKHFEPLEVLLASSEPHLLEMLIHIMGYMKSRPSWEALLTLLRHKSEGVRKKALKAIIRRNGEILEEIFWLTDDPDENVRQLFLQFLSRTRNEKAEKLLLGYLEQHRIRSSNKHRLFIVYSSLGKCGSDRSIAFLKKDFYFWQGLGILRSKKSPRRQAAIYALRKLKTEQAELILKRINARVFKDT